jgi:predicted helicase
LEKYILLGTKREVDENVLFSIYSNGVVTNRDAWCYNLSNKKLKNNMLQTTSFYNSEMERYHEEIKNLAKETYPNLNNQIQSGDTVVSVSPSISASHLVCALNCVLN